MCIDKLHINGIENINGVQSNTYQNILESDWLSQISVIKTRMEINQI